MFLLSRAGFAQGVDFESEVLPIITKAGCNAGACHGAASGRGGFRLSLYGQRPEDDYHSIVSQLRGRRVNLLDPQSSLLLRKGAEFIAHEGGMRLDPNAPDYQSIASWIEQGVPRGADPRKRFSTIEIQPPRIVVQDGVGTQARLMVYARVDGEGTYLANSLATFTPMDPDAVEVSQDGQFRALRHGRHTVLVRVRDQVATAEIVVPWRVGPRVEPQAGTSQSVGETQAVSVVGTDRRIDDLIRDQHEMLGVLPLGIADEQVLFRRVTLDLTGRIPTPAQWLEYQSFPVNQRYQSWVDRLIQSDEAAEYWGYFLAQHLEVSRLAANGQPEAAVRYRQVLHNAARDGTPLPELLAELVNASEESGPHVPDGFYRLGKDGRDLAELFARQFLGIRLQCANCHDHPLDRWTQDDYHGLASLFSSLQRNQQIQFRKGTRYIHPRDGQVIGGKIPDGPSIDSDTDPRPHLARWIREEGRIVVLRSWVNRVWHHLLGRGLVEPIDDLRATNPPTNALLLEHLTQSWDSMNGDWRSLVRKIVMSEAYQRCAWSVQEQSQSEDTKSPYPKSMDGNLAESLLVGRSIRRLPAEVLLDAWSDLLTSHEDEAEFAVPTRAVRAGVVPKQMVQTADSARCDSGTVACIVDLEDSLRGRLAMIAGETINHHLERSDGSLQRLAEQYPNDLPSIVRKAFLLAWTRDVSEKEVEYWVDQLEKEQDMNAALHDFYWSLVTSEGLIYVR